MNPEWPIFIPSRGRAATAITPRVLDQMGVPYRLIVEDAEHDAYANRFGESRLLVLPQSYLDAYETGDPEGDAAGLPKGSGAPRNYAWDLAAERGQTWHWVVDDNIRYFARMHGNHFFRAGDGWLFAAMEDHTARYTNVGGSAPEYESMMAVREPHKHPFRYNRRLMSCILLRTAVPLRWRLRGNEDIDLSIRLLNAGWCTLSYVAFLQGKASTQKIGGGYTNTAYAGGTGGKTMTLVRAHPQIVTQVVRYGRPHHHVDWDRWKHQHPTRDPDWTPPETSPYPTRLTSRIPFSDSRAAAKVRARQSGGRAL